MTPSQLFNTFGKFLGSKWTKGSIGTAIIGFIIYFGGDVVKVAENAVEYKNKVDSIAVIKKEITEIKNSVDWILLQQSTTIENISNKIDDLDRRENEKDVILLEELDRVDTNGVILERTNPGNLYYYDQNGHFIRVVFDYKVKKWYYLFNGKRIYL
jgi:hypothetical protein